MRQSFLTNTDLIHPFPLPLCCVPLFLFLFHLIFLWCFPLFLLPPHLSSIFQSPVHPHPLPLIFPCLLSSSSYPSSSFLLFLPSTLLLIFFLIPFLSPSSSCINFSSPPPLPFTPTSTFPSPFSFLFLPHLCSLLLFLFILFLHLLSFPCFYFFFSLSSFCSSFFSFSPLSVLKREQMIETETESTATKGRERQGWRAICRWDHGRCTRQFIPLGAVFSGPTDYSCSPRALRQLSSCTRGPVPVLCVMP